MVRKNLVLAVLLQVAALPVLNANAGNVGVDLNIRIGGEPRPVIVTQPPPAYAPAPEYVDEVEEEVEFIYPEPLGFYVAVGVPYDLFFMNSRYYMVRDGRWFRSPSSRGGWAPVRYRELPPPLRRHRLERIREYRAREYDVYRHDREHYRGRHRADKGYWKAARREEHRAEKQERREEKRFEKEQRHEEKRFEKEHRRERGRD
ncbi:MAG TPA: hypothetical protein DCZ75_15635 [Geobacter sp.]|nr:hypothetical protein [Geobacter sp.]